MAVRLIETTLSTNAALFIMFRSFRRSPYKPDCLPAALFSEVCREILENRAKFLLVLGRDHLVLLYIIDYFRMV